MVHSDVQRACATCCSSITSNSRCLYLRQPGLPSPGAPSRALWCPRCRRHVGGLPSGSAWPRDCPRSGGITGVQVVDLVLLSLGGVQRFIGESRSTADVAGASKIVQDLAGLAAHAVQRRLDGSPAPCGLIFPVAPDAPSVTNKIAFLAREGTGPGIARAAVEGISRSWRDRLEETFKTGQPPRTPGTPDLTWVSVTGPATDGDYGVLWKAAQCEMVGRRRARVFEPVEIPQRSCLRSRLGCRPSQRHAAHCLTNGTKRCPRRDG